jgi:tyrosine-protein kinase Etk/Wzc
MEQTINHNRQAAPEPEGINIRQLMLKMVKNWYWFAIFGAIGVALAFVYNHYSSSRYKISSTILVKAENVPTALTTLYKDLGINKNVNVQNQVGVLSSYNLNLRTLQNLNWEVSWYEERAFNNIDLYKDVPFEVVKTEGRTQTAMVPIHIAPLSENEYRIACDKTMEVYGVKRKVKFEAIGEFGKPFRNAYFDFVLHKIEERPASPENKYVLTFNDLGQLAIDYQENLEVRMGDEESNLIYLTLTSKHPERAIDYLNELSAMYIKFGLDEKNRLAENTVNFIDLQIKGITDSLQNTGKDFTDFRTNNRIVDVEKESSAIMKRMEKLDNEESISRMRLDYFNSIKRYISNSGAMKNLAAPSVVGVTDPSLNNLLLQLGDLFRQREILSYSVPEGNPQLKQLDDQIAYTQRSLGENINNLLSNTQLELRNLSRQRQRANSELAAMPKTEQNLNNIKRTFDLNNELYTFLLKKRSEAEIAQASRDPDAQVLDEASPGTVKRLGFGKELNLVIGLLAGMMLPFVFIFVRTSLQSSLESVSDISNELNLSVIGNIGNNKFEDELPVINYPHSEITESFRGLRLNIRHLLAHVDRKVIAVHSARAGEGKTFVSANLAAIIAMNNEKVLLIDADLRKPRTHDILNCRFDVGLSTFLNGDNTFDEVVSATNIKGLSFVSSGPKPSYPSELLSNSLLDDFIREAKSRYDYVIFNNAPVSIVNDAMMIIPYADMNLFLLRMKSSTKNELAYLNRVAQEGVIKNMAVALNNVTQESYGLYGSRDHGYYNEDRMVETKRLN